MSEYVYATDEHEGHWLTGEEIVRSRDGIPIVGIDDSLWRDYFDEFADEIRELMEVEQ